MMPSGAPITTRGMPRPPSPVATWPRPRRNIKRPMTATTSGTMIRNQPSEDTKDNIPNSPGTRLPGASLKSYRKNASKSGWLRGFCAIVVNGLLSSPVLQGRGTAKRWRGWLCRSVLCTATATPSVTRLRRAPPPPLNGGGKLWRFYQRVSHQLLQQGRCRIRMRAVLPEAFGIRDAEVPPAPFRPVRHGARIVGDAVLLLHPGDLALMRGKHLLLGLEEAFHIHRELRHHLVVVAVAPFDGIAEIQMRNLRQQLCVTRAIILHRRRETGIAHQRAHRFMVGMIVRRRCGDDQLRLRGANRLRHLAARRVVISLSVSVEPQSPAVAVAIVM